MDACHSHVTTAVTCNLYGLLTLLSIEAGGVMTTLLEVNIFFFLSDVYF